MQCQSIRPTNSESDTERLHLFERGRGLNVSPSILFCFSKRFKTYQTVVPNFSKSNGPKTLIPQMEFTHWSEQSHSRVPLRIHFVVSVIYMYIYLSLPSLSVSLSLFVGLLCDTESDTEYQKSNQNTKNFQCH